MEIARIINSVFTSNTFVLTEEVENYCWLVDVGDVEPIIDIVGNRELKGILLTHSHFDHIYGVNKIIERFPNCVVYTSIDGKEGLYSDKYNFSRYHGESIIFEGENIHVFTDGEEIQVFPSINMKAILTPGHDRSCVTYYTEDDIFTGDSYAVLYLKATSPSPGTFAIPISVNRTVSAVLTVSWSSIPN